MVEPELQVVGGRSGAADLPWAVVGAGPHGLAALKALGQLGVAARGMEQAADVGGLWNAASPAGRGYESLHMVSSTQLSQFPDFPVPLDYPAYPSRDQAQDYLRRYASHFGLYDQIRFGCEVTAVRPADDGVDLTVRDLLTDEVATTRYAGAVLATGPQRVPAVPDLPGLARFPGDVRHAGDYRGAAELRGRRVLVVGGGTSGCDIAVDAGLSADLALHSTRRGLRVTPTFAFGRPVDQMAELLGALRVPPRLLRLLAAGLRRMQFGSSFDQADGTAARNQLLPALVGCGRVIEKPALEGFDEDTAVFVDGSAARVDLVVLATGYREELPFGLTTQRLRRGLFPTGHDRLAVPGFLPARGAVWPLAHWQGMLIAHYARALAERGDAAQGYLADLPTPAADGWDRQRYLRTLERDIRILEAAQ